MDSEKANNLGLMLCIENMFARNHMLVEPDDFEDIFRLFPSLRFTLDMDATLVETFKKGETSGNYFIPWRRLGIADDTGPKTKIQQP